MLNRLALLVLTTSLGPAVFSQETVTYKSAIVALTDDEELRISFEDSLAEKARAHRYDAVASYGIVPEVGDIDDRGFASSLASRGIQAVLMLRPASVGAGSSLESVRNEVSARVFADMQRFAKEVSSADTDELIAVVHMAIYMITESRPELISAGAVWLDEEVETREQGIERLQDLIVANVDAARPAIREHLGLPPLE